MNKLTACTLVVVTETSKTTNFQPYFFYITFLYWLVHLPIDMTFCFFRRVKETNETTNLEARFFYNLLIIIFTCCYYFSWQVLSFMEDFAQTNVFA